MVSLAASALVKDLANKPQSSLRAVPSGAARSNFSRFIAKFINASVDATSPSALWVAMSR